MRKVLVTGSSGYIGRHLLKVLPDYHTVGLDRIFKPQLADKFIHQDILESKLVEGEYDTVVHLAALVNVGDSMKNPMRYYDTNVTGTLRMLEHTDFKHFIFASTGAAVNPTSPYALSKRQTSDLQGRLPPAVLMVRFLVRRRQLQGRGLLLPAGARWALPATSPRSRIWRKSPSAREQRSSVASAWRALAPCRHKRSKLRPTWVR